VAALPHAHENGQWLGPDGTTFIVMDWAPVWLLWVLIASFGLLVQPDPTANVVGAESDLA